MRKVLLIAGAVIGILAIVVIAVFIYAAVNLNSIVQRNRGYLLARASQTLDRPVHVSGINVSVGWGLTVTLHGLEVGDDPAFSKLPFVTASRVLCRVALLPVLAGRLSIARLDLLNPRIRILRNRAGVLNISTLGKHRTAPAASPGTGPAKPAPTAAPPGTIVQSAPSGPRIGPVGISVGSLEIQNGDLVYQDEASGAAPIRIAHTDLSISGLRPDTPFRLQLALAAMSKQQNLRVQGTVGPLLQQGAIEPAAVPIDLTVDLGPIFLRQLRELPQLRDRIPGSLAIANPIMLKTRLKGTLRSLEFTLNSDLTSAGIEYSRTFNKPAGTTMRVAADGSLRQGTVALKEARLDLADLDARLSDVALQQGVLSAKLATNRFALAPIAAMIPAAAEYRVGGSAQANLKVSRNPGAMPQANGTVEFTKVELTPVKSKLPGVRDLSGSLRLAGNSATLAPTTFRIGTQGQAKLQAQAQSLNPLRASYSLEAQNLRLADFLPARASGEHVDDLSVDGTLSQAGSGPAATANLASGSGNVANVAYKNLKLVASYAAHVVKIQQLQLAAFGGTIKASGQEALAAARNFSLSADLANVDLQQALAAQNSKASAIVRGRLSGQVTIDGRGSDFARIKPTLSGRGRLQIAGGKLVGVNVVGQALRKINGLPGIDTLLTSSIVAGHPALFNSPDTDLKAAHLTFTMSGPRINSNDITVASDDYQMLGRGWFDLDKRVDLALQILMSRQFSSQLRAQKKNVVYLMNPDGEIVIPLRVSGTLPKPLVTPDITDLAQRAAGRAIEHKGSELLQRFLGKKKSGGSSAQPTPSSPLERLKRFLP